MFIFGCAFEKFLQIFYKLLFVNKAILVLVNLIEKLLNFLFIWSFFCGLSKICFDLVNIEMTVIIGVELVKYHVDCIMSCLVLIRKRTVNLNKVLFNLLSRVNKLLVSILSLFLLFLEFFDVFNLRIGCIVVFHFLLLFFDESSFFPEELLYLLFLLEDLLFFFEFLKGFIFY